MMNKETIKEFLKPDWKKILFTLLLLGVTFFYAIQPSVKAFEVGLQHGLPLPYILEEKEILFTNYPEDATILTSYLISYSGLLIDTIFWYLISCLIIFIYNKFRGRKL